MGVHNGRSFQRLSKGAFIERHQVEYIASDWRWKHGAPLQGEDIVRSVWKHAGVHKRTGKGLATLPEHIVSWRR
jgi:hypothetical protein